MLADLEPRANVYEPLLAQPIARRPGVAYADPENLCEFGCCAGLRFEFAQN